MTYFGKNAILASCDFNGTNNSISHDFNISSVGDQGTGHYRFNMDSGSSNANDYIPFAGVAGSSGDAWRSAGFYDTRTTTRWDVQARYQGTSAYDVSLVATGAISNL